MLSSLLAELCFDAMARAWAWSVTRMSRSPSCGPRARPRPASRARGGDAVDLSTGEWILNPGSVGQPRDGDSRAAWLLLDLDLWRAQWRRTDYDVSGAQAAIRNARLPGSLAERLEYGQ